MHIVTVATGDYAKGAAALVNSLAATGFAGRITVGHQGATGVSLRFVPEIHHGPVQKRYDQLPNSGASLSAMQFMIKDGQQEETLRELAASLVLEPGQVAVDAEVSASSEVLRVRPGAQHRRVRGDDASVFRAHALEGFSA